ncbi:hypothetical protein ID866_6003 [Astraeus odoratus]|nr:hypothetical protein ID866_6003 [Astraeus odoratus]
MSIGEMTAYAPISGSLLHFAARWLDPAAGFALGWNYYYYVAIVIPLEITAITALVTTWDVDPNHTAIYIGVVIVGLFVINLFGMVWSFRNCLCDTENYAGIKPGGLVISLGGGPNHDRIGFRYWKDPGPMVSTLEPGATGRFLGLLVAIVPAAFSVSGFELIAISAAESVQPRTNIIRAMKYVIFRLIFFYICSVIIVGMLVPSNYPYLSEQSPFVIAFQTAGVKALPSIINAIVIASAFSSANTCLFSASRILYGLAVQNQAPEVFAKCTDSGVPWVALMTSGLFPLLAFMSVSANSTTVFNWFVHLTTVCGLIGWTTINVTYLRYYYGLRLQGLVPRGVYRSPLQPYAAMWAAFWSVFYILISGLSVFFDFTASSFVSSYINIPIFFALLLGYKLWFKTEVKPLADLDFISNIPTLEQTQDEGLLSQKTPPLQKMGLV